MSFAQRYRLRIKDLKWFTGLYQILSEFGHFKATWSVMYTFKGRYQSNSTVLHPLPTRSTCPESLGQKRFTKNSIRPEMTGKKSDIRTFLELVWFIWRDFSKTVPINRKIMILGRNDVIKWFHKVIYQPRNFLNICIFECRKFRWVQMRSIELT